MKPWVVTVEDIEYDVDAPDEVTAWQWAYSYHQDQKAKDPLYMDRQKFRKEAGKNVENLGGMLEAGSSIIRQLPGYISGGLVGAGALATGQGIDAAAAQQRYVTEKLNEFFGATPKTERGKEHLEKFGEAFYYPVERAKEVGSKVAGSEGELVAGVVAETLLNFMPLKAGKSALEKAKKSKSLDALKEQPKVDKTEQVLDNLDKLEEVKKQEEQSKQISEEIKEQVEQPKQVEVSSKKRRTITRKQIEESIERQVNEQPVEKVPSKMLEEESFFEFNKGIKYKDPTTGKIVQGMDESVPTIDFPLRAEVLERPEVAEKINQFIEKAEELKKAGDTESLTKLQEEFGEFAKLFGLYNDGWRGKGRIYESVYREDIPFLRYPGGIRKSGEFQTRKTETEIPVIKERPEKFPLQLSPRNKQLGAIDPKVFVEGIKKLGDLVGKLKPTGAISVTQKDLHRVESYRKILGQSSVKDALIPVDPDVGQVIAEAKKATPVSDHVALIGGGEMMAEIKQSPIISAVYQMATNAEKRANYLISKHVHPLIESVHEIGRSEKDIKLLADIVMKEFREGTRYTPEQLEAAGASPKVVAAYKNLRETFDKAYEVQNAALVDLGKKPLTRLEAYFASRWNGDWRIPVYSRKGELLWWIAAQTKWGAKRAFEHVKNNFDDIDIEKSKLRYVGGKTRLTSSKADAGYYELLSVLDKEDPRVQVLKSIFEDYVTASGFFEKGQPKHFKPKSGVRGFVGDRPWHKNDAVEFIKQQISYAENAFHWAEDQMAVKKAKEILANEELQISHPNDIKIAKEYLKNKLGYGDLAVVNYLESELVKALGISRSTLEQSINIPRKLFYLWTLGFYEPGYVITSLVQPVYTIPWHIKLMREGYDYNPITNQVKASVDALALFMEHYHTKNVFTSEVGYLAAKYALDNGVINITPLSELTEISMPRALVLADKIAASNMTLVEQVTRAYSFMSFVHHLDASGMFKGKELEMFQKAESLTKLSMVDFRRSERAPIFNRLGILGTALSTLNQFRVNIYNQLYALSKHAIKTGDYYPIAAMLAIQLTLAGARGLFFVETVDSVWEFIKQKLPTNLWLKLKNFSIREFLAKTAFENPETSWLGYGAISKATGINLSGRFDLGTVVDPTIEGLLPFVGNMEERLSDIARMALDPTDPVKQAQGIRGMLPRAFHGLYETSSDIFSQDLPGGGEMATKIRNPLQGVYRRNEREMFLRKFNLYSPEEGLVRELDYFHTKREKQIEERRKDTAEKLKNAAIFGTPERVRDLLQQYQELNGNIPDLERMLGEAVVRRMITKLEELQMKSGSPTGARRLKDYVR